jgi:hypothetical protein
MSAGTKSGRHIAIHCMTYTPRKRISSINFFPLSDIIINGASCKTLLGRGMQYNAARLTLWAAWLIVSKKRQIRVFTEC